jgi:hypothetical protein
MKKSFDHGQHLLFLAFATAKDLSCFITVHVQHPVAYKTDLPPCAAWHDGLLPDVVTPVCLLRWLFSHRSKDKGECRYGVKVDSFNPLPLLDILDLSHQTTTKRYLSDV